MLICFILSFFYIFYCRILTKCFDLKLTFFNINNLDNNKILFIFVALNQKDKGVKYDWADI